MYMMITNILKAVAGVYLSATAFAVNAGTAATQTPDSVYLFAYSKPEGNSGLRFAWSQDNKKWDSVADSKSTSKSGYNFVSSDFGPWGSHKKMFEPVLYKDTNGWTAVWFVSDKRETLASAFSSDLIHWEPQRYAVGEDSDKPGFRGQRAGTVRSIELNGKRYTGTSFKVPHAVVAGLLKYVDERGVQSRLDAELMKDDGKRFSCLGNVRVSVNINPEQKPKDISDKLIGIFFEDISYGADGGLYAEMIQNRDFEYDFNENHKNGWGPEYSWQLKDLSGNKLKMYFDTIAPIHVNNPTYVKISDRKTPLKLTNTGYDGISVIKGETYRFSMFVRNSDGKGKIKFNVRLLNHDGKVAGIGCLTASGRGWQHIKTDIKAKESVTNGSIEIEIPANANCDLDMISLFPRNTYKGRENGLRKDLAEALESLHPKFVRFPGGCVAHGDGIDNIYDWKGSIGPIESRKPLRNIWNYHQSRGLGYHEYFLMCEDMQAEPLPVLAAGVPCQNSGRSYSGSHNEITSLGQQCGVPMEKMDEYVQDILDLIEYANGSVDSEWGRRRAEAGHPAPFNLKYIGIGNEDMITEVFEERFKYIHDILKEKHPEITIVGTVGPFYEGSDYVEGWKFARKENVAVVDEHYYVSPGWYLNHRDFYDSYDRSGPKVYLGEYASHLPDRKNTLETALTVALYLTDVERNGDVVEMTSYAPLLARKGHENWRPDLIFFTNDSVMLTPDYYVQQMYGQNSGTIYIPSLLKISEKDIDVAKRIGHSMVRDVKNGDLIIKIANLLPVGIDWTENFREFGVGNLNCKNIVLTGLPDEECTKPIVESVLIQDGDMNIKIAPYSFNVIRVPFSE